ncbi:Type 1 glutamine amidotransferase-like domain-containing protein [Bacillus sp. FJAT-49711]|uniref:Type 1 glutamine amidotransferase-like domain-containing protein n=1 Tax=Bacillus sp. FJAT-49711 TaxID=2833585 RepID=UPI0020162BFD|nr:Type 1 glutamine amidotransferase-like domain-containing protein [Bacillus sp. FJAT-49711]
MANLFVRKASCSNQPVSILFVEREGWEEYMPVYTGELEKLGIHNFHYLPLRTTPIEQAVKCITNSSGIVIGGGDTNLYADYIVDTEISKVLKNRYEQGAPVAGFSAGALISPELCVISPNDNVQNEFQHRRGLGLLSNVLIAVHYSEWNDEDHLRNAASHFSNHVNYGIDERTGMYFLNGHLESTDGEGVYQLENGIINKIN